MLKWSAISSEKHKSTAEHEQGKRSSVKVERNFKQYNKILCSDFQC